jgi:hypothetical protein
MFLYFFALPGAASFPRAGRDTGDVRNTVEKTRDSGVVYNDASGSRVVISGAGRIPDNTAQGKLLARRAALTDARRNLLALRHRLLKDPRFKSQSSVHSVSGRLSGPSQTIRSERVEGGLFFLELDMRLDDLLNTAFDENFFVLQ